MVVKTIYPGATAQEVEDQVTDRLEKKLQELPSLDYLRSYSKAGESVIFINAREDISPQEIQLLWYSARKKTADIKLSLPPGIIGPFFNDEFGDTYSLLYAFSGEGFDYAELKDIVDAARQRLLRVKDVEKVDLIGAQEEKIFIEFNDKHLATLGLDAVAVAQVLQSQNSLMPAGTVLTGLQDVPIRLTGAFKSVAEIADMPIRINGRTFKTRDIATIRRGYQDPVQFKMRFNGKEVIGLGITMNKRGNILNLGEALQEEMTAIEQTLPIGVDVEKVADQAQVVNTAIGEFLRTFFEALVAVLLASFISLGLRTGSVVALTVPLVLAATLLVMLLVGMEVHRISLGALILALGLLVDDAMIAIK